MNKHKVWVASAFVIGLPACADSLDDDFESSAISQPLTSTSIVEGNPTCEELGLGRFEFKVEYDEGAGSHHFDGYNTVDITFRNTALGEVVDFASTLGLDGLIVKGGPRAAVYPFDPEETSGNGLAPPINPNNGSYYGISHVTWCYDYELTVTKTARPSYTRTWSWEIFKSVDPSEHQLYHGDAELSRYEVTVERVGFEDGDFRVAGEVTVTNATPFPAELTSVVDQLSNETVVSLACDAPTAGTLASGASIHCSYELALHAPENLVNHAVASTAVDSLVGDSSASANIDFSTAIVTAVNETVTVEDDYEGSVTTLGVVSDSHVFEYPRTFTCEDEGLKRNTATIVETGAAADADVRVVCAFPDAQGCTPGYWKNHPAAWAPTGYAASTLVRAVFDRSAPYVRASDTLMNALSYKGGSTVTAAAQTLLRASVASLLDAAHPDIAYPLTAQEVIERTNAAIESGDREMILETKDILDQYNNLGCPL